MSRLKTEYEKNGFYSPVSVIDASLAKDYRVILENVESKIELLNYRYKIHTALDFAYQIAINEKLLNKVEYQLSYDEFQMDVHWLHHKLSEA